MTPKRLSAKAKARKRFMAELGRYYRSDDGIAYQKFQAGEKKELRKWFKKFSADASRLTQTKERRDE